MGNSERKVKRVGVREGEERKKGVGVREGEWREGVKWGEQR